MAAPVTLRRYDRPREGPEADLMETLSDWCRRLVGRSRVGYWMASGMPIGSGQPDLVIANYRPEVAALRAGSAGHAWLLAYLHSVSAALPETMARFLGATPVPVESLLEDLTAALAVEPVRQSFRLTRSWREILPRIVTVEAKVSDWRRAAEQAARNRIFSHESYVALPMELAERVCSDDLFTSYRLGVLGVDDDADVSILRPAPRAEPRVWVYYYRIAVELAASLEASSECHTQSRSRMRRSSFRTTSS